MNTGAEKFAQTDPITEVSEVDEINEVNDVDKLGKQAGLEMDDRETLGLKKKLEERDDSRLDIDNANQNLAD